MNSSPTPHPHRLTCRLYIVYIETVIYIIGVCLKYRIHVREVSPWRDGIFHCQGDEDCEWAMHVLVWRIMCGVWKAKLLCPHPVAHC